MKIKLTKLWNLSRCYSTNGWRLYHVSVVNIRRKNCIESLKKIIQRNTSWYNVWLCRFGQITEASVHVKIFWRHFYGSVEVNAHVFTCTNHAILHTMNNMTFVNNGKTNIRKLFFYELELCIAINRTKRKKIMHVRSINLTKSN